MAILELRLGTDDLENSVSNPCVLRIETEFPNRRFQTEFGSKENQELVELLTQATRFSFQDDVPRLVEG